MATRQPRAFIIIDPKDDNANDDALNGDGRLVRFDFGSTDGRQTHFGTYTGDTISAYQSVAASKLRRFRPDGDSDLALSMLDHAFRPFAGQSG